MFEVVRGELRCDGRARGPADIREQAIRLRFKLAINLFKRYVLGSTHMPDRPQVDEMLRSPAASRLFEVIDVRTWRSWFDSSSPIPKRKSVRALDLIAQESIRVTYTCSDLDYVLAPGFFAELVHGGLVSEMARAGGSKRARAALCAAVDQYVPLSAWHLHMDAIEVSGLAEDLGGLPWFYVKHVAAKRLMSLLYVLWAPRGGVIYRLFASGLRMRWNAASEEERVLLRERHTLVAGGYFDSRLRAVPFPNWSSIGVSGDLVEEHIYKALLAMAADPAFLVAERKHAWALDLASSALAMHALAWSDRYQTFGSSLTEERIFWRLLAEMFFTLKSSRHLDHRTLNAAMGHLGLPWSRTLRRTLQEGRSSYLNEIAALGVDLSAVLTVARHASDVHPLVYQGG